MRSFSASFCLIFLLLSLQNVPISASHGAAMLARAGPKRSEAVIVSASHTSIASSRDSTINSLPSLLPTFHGNISTSNSSNGSYASGSSYPFWNATASGSFTTGSLASASGTADCSGPHCSSSNPLSLTSAAGSAGQMTTQHANLSNPAFAATLSGTGLPGTGTSSALATGSGSIGLSIAPSNASTSIGTNTGSVVSAHASAGSSSGTVIIIRSNSSLPSGPSITPHSAILPPPLINSTLPLSGTGAAGTTAIRASSSTSTLTMGPFITSAIPASVISNNSSGIYVGSGSLSAPPGNGLMGTSRASFSSAGFATARNASSATASTLSPYLSGTGVTSAPYPGGSGTTSGLFASGSGRSSAPYLSGSGASSAPVMTLSPNSTIALGMQPQGTTTSSPATSAPANDSPNGGGAIGAVVGGGVLGGVVGGGVIGGNVGGGGAGGIVGGGVIGSSRGGGGGGGGSQNQPGDSNPNDSKPDDSERDGSDRKNPSATVTGRQQTSLLLSTITTPLSSTPALSSTAPPSSTTCADCVDCDSINYSGGIVFPASNATDNDPDDRLNKRALAGRFYVEKRSIGNTKDRVARVANAPRYTDGIKGCPVNTYFAKPDYPGPNDVWRFDTNPNVRNFNWNNLGPFVAGMEFWAVPVQPDKRCDAPQWKFMASSDIIKKPQKLSRGDKDPDGYNAAPWEIGSRDEKAKAVNMDHVYELSVLDEFFVTQYWAKRFGCPEITTLFDQPDGVTGGTRLNTIFGQLASFQNPDFVGMDQALNQLKGSLWNRLLDGYPAVLPDGESLKKALSQIALVMSMANDPTVDTLWQNTNGRIYQAFQGIDNLITTGNKDCPNQYKDSRGVAMSATWADSYKTYISSKISAQNVLIQNTAASLSAAIPTHPAQVANPNEKGKVAGWQFWLNGNFIPAYPIASMTFPAATNWPTTPLNIMKRDAAANACPLGVSSTLANSIPSMTVGTGQSGSTMITPAPVVGPIAALTASSAAENKTFVDGVDQNNFGGMYAAPPSAIYPSPAASSFAERSNGTNVSTGPQVPLSPTGVSQPSTPPTSIPSFSNPPPSSIQLPTTTQQSSLASRLNASTTTQQSSLPTQLKSPTNPDPCGPYFQKPNYFNTCNAKIHLTETPSQYSFMCQQSGSTAITYTSCELVYTEMCKRMSSPSSNSQHAFKTDEWVWLQNGGCAIGVFMPRPISQGGQGAEWPSQSQCERNIFQPMRDTCGPAGAGLASVNIAQWPSFEDKRLTGQQVEFGYPSYMIAPAQPKGLGLSTSGWVGSAPAVVEAPANELLPNTTRGGAPRCPAGTCYQWCICP